MAKRARRKAGRRKNGTFLKGSTASRLAGRKGGLKTWSTHCTRKRKRRR